MKAIQATYALLMMFASILFSSELLAEDNIAQLFADIRIGYISSKDEAGNIEKGSAFGGKIGGITQNWQGFRAGGTLFTTQKLFNDEQDDFFGADGKGYTILGEAYLQANMNNTEIKVGRLAFDSPHADTDDIRMIANNFSGIALTNTDISDTTLYLAHFQQWAGFDSDEPEHFTDLNDDKGITVIGATYEGIENTAIQSWYYLGKALTNIFYLDAIFVGENFTIGGQFSHQMDKTSNSTGADGEVYGINTSYTINHLTLSAAYNHVSGIVINGFGGGPFFTSSADHTIEGVIDQNALAIGLEYTGIDGVSFNIMHVNFAQGASETDYSASWVSADNSSFEVIYHDMHEDGEMLLLMFNYGF